MNVIFLYTQDGIWEIFIQGIGQTMYLICNPNLKSATRKSAQLPMFLPARGYFKK